MHITGGYHRFPQFKTDFTYFAVNIPQVFFRRHLAFPQQKEIIRNGLYLQVIVEGGNLFHLLIRRVA